MTLHVLFDQDGVLSHWGNGFSSDPKIEPYPNIPRHEDQRSFNLKTGLTHEEAMIIDEVFNTMSYRNLQPIEGAVEAYAKTVEAGFHVSIVTSPWWTNPTCLQDKADWVEAHLGADARRNMILGEDKTRVRGNYLIDDKPNITGHYTHPEWKQILFDQPYNREVDLPRIMSWENWNPVEFFDSLRVDEYLKWSHELFEVENKK